MLQIWALKMSCSYPVWGSRLKGLKLYSSFLRGNKSWEMLLYASHRVTGRHFPCCHLLNTQQYPSRTEIWHSWHNMRPLNRFLCWENFTSVIWVICQTIPQMKVQETTDEHRGIDLDTDLWSVHTFMFVCATVDWHSHTSFTYCPCQMFIICIIGICLEESHSHVWRGNVV